ncbi:hypothetical protein [Bradyrhizobium elkanii]|uniref:hypothetical protein n=1 Tax=Bradyrhizobium elkanii TaxID=29448 RepID=UPI00056DF4BD
MLAGAAFVLIGCTFVSIPALAERRVALVIGNSAYRNTVQLPNPRDDTADGADATSLTPELRKAVEQRLARAGLPSAHPTATMVQIRWLPCKAQYLRSSRQARCGHRSVTLRRHVFCDSDRNHLR